MLTIVLVRGKTLICRNLLTWKVPTNNVRLTRVRNNIKWTTKGPATRNDFVNDIVDDARADAIFATLKTIVDDGSSTISSTISLRVAGP